MTHRNAEPTSRILKAAACAALLVAAGCESEPSLAEGDEPLALVAQAGPEAPITLKPEGVYFAEVTASGTGCPAGSWASSISSDGQVFTTTFSAYEIKVEGETATSTRDCALSMKLHSDAPREFAVISVYYSGYALLEQGVTARQTVRYGFHGAAADAGNSRTDFTGPEERDFVIRDDVGVERQKWSACGSDHTLTASTELRMQRRGAEGSGYINLSAVDGSLKLELRLGWRGCNARGNGNTPGRPGAAQPAATQPGATKPAATQPGAAQPGKSDGTSGNGRANGNGRTTGNAPAGQTTTT